MVISASLPTIALATGEDNVGESITSWALRGAFYRLNYIFQDKYIIEFNGRYDGSSKFPKDKAVRVFPILFSIMDSRQGVIHVRNSWTGQSPETKSIVWLAGKSVGIFRFWLHRHDECQQLQLPDRWRTSVESVCSTISIFKLFLGGSYQHLTSVLTWDYLMTRS